MRTLTLLSIGAVVCSLMAHAGGMMQASPTKASPAKSGAEVAKEPAAERDRYVLVRCGRLLAVPGEAVTRDVTIVIKNRRIERIMPGFDGPDLAQERAAGADVVETDLRDRFVLPGLIDCHVHLTFEMGPDNALRVVTESTSDRALRGVVFARRTLEAGFTTVRDLGGEAEAIFALRDAINRGDVPGPRILAAGKAISVTGGHADPGNGLREDVFCHVGPEVGVADGPDECLKAVRMQVKRGADVIKIMATGGVLSRSAAGLAQHFTEEELRALVAAAHSMKRKIAAHAHGTDGINAALRAGVDSIEHGTFSDEETLRLLKEKKAWLVPTLLASATSMENARKPGYYIEAVAKKAMEAGPARFANFTKSVAAGVAVAFGTDSGVSAHGQNAREFGLLVQCGMTPEQCVIAATRNAAGLLGLADEIGTLEPGKLADLIGVDGDPLRDVGVFGNVRFVMRGGVVVKDVGLARAN
ncbi:MAG: amidohydrolase family protein [Planctomycetota bacterium]|nr:amidohydrolase family protein [Planctomycetota bacterium]